MTSLDDYYIKLMNDWGIDNNEYKSGWANLYYGIFSDIIKQNNYKICVEVGIGYGFHAKTILKDCGNIIDKLYLVDPLKEYNNDGFSNDIMTKCCGFENLYKNIVNNLKQYEDKYTLFRCASLDISEQQIPDQSVDAIFLDGDHSYDMVLKDLEFWWKKLKKGGMLLGDDYWMNDVSRAVNVFKTKQMYSCFKLLSKPNNNYQIYCFTK